MELAVRRSLLDSLTMELAVCFALSGRVFLSSRSVRVFTFREKGLGLLGVVTPSRFSAGGFALAGTFSFRDLSRTLRVLRIGFYRSQIGAWEFPTVPGGGRPLPNCTVRGVPPCTVSLAVRNDC